MTKILKVFEFHNWGFQVGRFNVCWYNLDAHFPCLELCWGARRLVHI